MGDLDDDLQIDLTPLIDVIFMLVIFFIMTTSFTLPVIDFNLPQASTAQSMKQESTLRVSVSREGEYKLEQDIVEKDILEELIQERSKKAPKITIELVIDKDSASEHLIYVADLARKYTEGRLVIVSEKGAEKEEHIDDKKQRVVQET